jgi:UDP-glucose 4-epimerase
MVTTCLITGGCGFVGSNLIGRLVQTRPGMRIIVLDNLTVGHPDDLRQYADFQVLEPQDLDESIVYSVVKGDIRDADVVDQVVGKGVNHIVHLAANTGVQPSIENPLEDCQSNVIGILNMLEAARKNNISRFVFSSSGAPIGIAEPPIQEETTCHPVSPYGASKLAGEAYCSAYYHSFDLESVVLRFSNVYGPGCKNKGSVVAKFLKNIIEGLPVTVNGDGRQTRDFIYVDDLVAVIDQVLFDENTGGEIFQVATGVETSVSQLVDIIRANVPDRKLVVEHADPLKGDVRQNYADISKIRNILRWEPEVELGKGVQETYKYLQTLYK